ncbi:cobalt-zinc-cadmium efflux system membrane fusion protein [Algoriphagus sp. 4150]|uniref:efflux RND transporter periplasmic adaptor subunit n=1 Tax=Algoriphagus sp. 4150 TaxID=2817756 RepID=UPI0028658B8A|nr:efflux RND transporter periplasmic adaptor subunit [Algoriphagus sp. 4150]MDR7130814.1 cobalt-zinc-cadmium efflux system membrane fusion protein [Algoriphagus sp. 4150]
MNRITTKTILTSCLIGVLFFSSCSNADEKQHIAENRNYCLDDNFKSKIELELPTKQLVTQGIPLTGIVESNPDNVIHFVSLVGGIISNTYFSLGDKVAKGQVLAELRSTELSELQSQSRTIVSQIQVAENNLRSIQSMYDDGIASQKDLMESQSDLEVMKAEKERIDANLSLFSASTEKGVFQIKSPSSGIVTSKSISGGTQISAEGEPLFTISDLSEVWVLVNVYATNVTNIDTGMDVSIKTLSYPDQMFEGKITAISQVLDAEAKVLKARVVLPNKDLKLKPGMIVDVTALKELQTEALSIPTSAMVFDSDQNYVVVHNGACEIEIRQVEILTKSNGVTSISGGINENEHIISKNHLLIYEQLKNFQN